MKRILCGLGLVCLLWTNAHAGVSAIVRCNGSQPLGFDITGVTTFRDAFGHIQVLPALPNWGTFVQQGTRFLFFCDQFGQLPPDGLCDDFPEGCFLRMVWWRTLVIPPKTYVIVSEDRSFDFTQDNRIACMLNESSRYVYWNFNMADCNVGEFVTTNAYDMPPPK